MKQCILCRSTEHNTPACHMRVVKAELTVSEWVSVHLLRKFGSFKVAAAAYGMAPNTLTGYIRGDRTMPPKLLEDAGVTFDARVQP